MSNSFMQLQRIDRGFYNFQKRRPLHCRYRETQFLEGAVSADSQLNPLNTLAIRRSRSRALGYSVVGRITFRLLT